MSRRLLTITGAFYVLFGVLLAVEPVSRLAVERSTFEEFVRAYATRATAGALLTAAGVVTLAAAWQYDSYVLRIIGAGLRAGSMAALSLLSLLVWLFTPRGSPLAVVLFAYLTVLSLLTVPPPFPEPVEHALQQLREDRPPIADH